MSTYSPPMQQFSPSHQMQSGSHEYPPLDVETKRELSGQMPVNFDQSIYPDPNGPVGAHPHEHDHDQQHVTGDPLAGAIAAPHPTHSSEAKNRLRKACDSCSVRKVKVRLFRLFYPHSIQDLGIFVTDGACVARQCDESGPPCKACADLGIPCTFNRPSRRRGPPNRHAEAIKKRRFDSTSGQSAPASPTHAAQTLASFAQQQVLSAESICPFPMVQLLVDDYFTYIHPLIPIPHEGTFRASLHRREDLHDPTFLALLASMVGCLVASFPSKPRHHLHTQNMSNLFPSSMSLVERCHKIAVEARGPGYLDRDFTVYDAAISYLQGLIGAYTFNWRQARVYFGQCLTISRVIGLDTGRGPPNRQSLQNGQELGVDIITQELGRRLFWTSFVGVKSLMQLGVSLRELILPPPTTSEPYPPFPLELDDEHIEPSHTTPQHSGVLSTLVGFNANVRVFMSCLSYFTFEAAYGPDVIQDWEQQRQMLAHCLRQAKSSLDSLPSELMLQPGSEIRDPKAEHQYPPVTGGHYDNHYLDQISGEALKGLIIERKRLQYEIQKANVHSTHLSVRSYLVEKYWNLHDAHRIKTGDGLETQQDDAIDQEMATEREIVVKDFLILLSTITQANMEPNGHSFVRTTFLVSSPHIV